MEKAPILLKEEESSSIHQLENSESSAWSPNQNYLCPISKRPKGILEEM